MGIAKQHTPVKNRSRLETSAGMKAADGCAKEVANLVRTLYERLGGRSGIAAIVNDLVDLHLENPVIRARFVNSDANRLKEAATLFFCAGSGGGESYSGKGMLEAHHGMNISEQEFMAVLDDAMAALEKQGVGQQEKMEVLFILHSMRKEVVRV